MSVAKPLTKEQYVKIHLMTIKGSQVVNNVFLDVQVI
jgi:hypothetical protein